MQVLLCLRAIGDGWETTELAEYLYNYAGVDFPVVDLSRYLGQLRNKRLVRSRKGRFNEKGKRLNEWSLTVEGIEQSEIYAEEIRRLGSIVRKGNGRF